MKSIDFKEIYAQLKTDLTVEELNFVELKHEKDDYKNKVIYLTKNHPRNNVPRFFIHTVEKININNFQALLMLLKQLKEIGLLIQEKPFITKSIKDKEYILSVQRTDRKYVDVYCESEESKIQILKDIKDFEERINISKL